MFGRYRLILNKYLLKKNGWVFDDEHQSSCPFYCLNSIILSILSFTMAALFPSICVQSRKEDGMAKTSSSLFISYPVFQLLKTCFPKPLWKLFISISLTTTVSQDICCKGSWQSTLIFLISTGEGLEVDFQSANIQFLLQIFVTLHTINT